MTKLFIDSKKNVIISERSEKEEASTKKSKSNSKASQRYSIRSKDLTLGKMRSNDVQ